MAPAAAAPPSLVDARAERALLGVCLREPHRFATDHKRLTRALFAVETARFTALAAAAARGELAGDPGTATAALDVAGLGLGAGLWVAEALLDAEDLVPEALIGHLHRLAKRRTARQLADGLRAVAEYPAPDEDRETLTTLSERVAALANGTRVAGTLMTAVEREDVAWLWRRRIPRGKLTLLDGDPGVGKTTVTMELAARVTRGHAMPLDYETPPPAGVVLVNAEDGLGDTLRPRLEAAGADLGRIRAFGVEGLLTFPGDLPQLRDAILDVGAALVIIDPFMAVLDPNIDTHRDQDVRRVLARLAGLATETNAAVVIVRHLTKAGGGRALYRGGGSIGIAGAARSVLLLGVDPEDEARRVLVGVKQNLSAPPDALALRFEPVAEAGSIRIEWIGVATTEADDMVATDSGAIGEAIHFLERLLEDGPVSAKLAEQSRKQLNISDYAYKEARRRLRVVIEKEGFSSGWTLALPRTGPVGGH